MARARLSVALLLWVTLAFGFISVEGWTSGRCASRGAQGPSAVLLLLHHLLPLFCSVPLCLQSHVL
jgi:hypothetical protein